MKTENQRKLLWKKKFKEKACVDIIGNRLCATAELEIKLYQDGGKFTLETRLGNLGTLSHDLKPTCYKNSSAPLSYEICLEDIKIENGRLVAIRLIADLCIDVKLGPFRVKECWKVLDSTIQLFTLNEIQSQTSPSTYDIETLEIFQMYDASETYVEVESRLIQ